MSVSNQFQQMLEQGATANGRQNTNQNRGGNLAQGRILSDGTTISSRGARSCKLFFLNDGGSYTAEAADYPAVVALFNKVAKDLEEFLSKNPATSLIQIRIKPLGCPEVRVATCRSTRNPEMKVITLSLHGDEKLPKGDDEVEVVGTSEIRVGTDVVVGENLARALEKLAFNTTSET